MGRGNQSRKLAWLLIAGCAGLAFAAEKSKELKYTAEIGRAHV